MILLMGIAGSGKGTQGKLLAEALGYKILSTGELLRNYGSKDQHARMLQGIILGDEEVTALLDKALDELDDQNKTIVDGYPRRIGQAEWLLEQYQAGRFELEYVLHLTASPQAVKDRLHARGRTDDHDAAIEARFQEYRETTVPILSYLSQQGIDVIEIDAERTIEQVHQNVLEKDATRRQEA